MSTRTIRLSEITSALESGGRPKGGAGNFVWGVLSLGGEHVSADGSLDLRSKRFVPVDYYEEMSRGQLRRRDILIVKDGATTGKVGFVDSSIPLPAAVNEHVFRLVVDEKVADQRYVFYHLLSPLGNQQILRDFRGATVGGISQDFLEFVELPFPDLSEQKRLALLLDKADRLRRMRRYALKLSDTLRASAFLELFGGNSVQGAPTVRELAARTPCAIRTGPFGSQLLHSEFTTSGIAVLGIDNAVNNRFEWSERRFISNKKYEELRRYTVFPGDVIITIMGTCGRCAIVQNDIPAAINTKHLCCITLDQEQCLPVYLHGAFLFHPSIRRQLELATKGAIMDGLNMGIIEGLRIPLPPRSAQQHFAELVRRYERLRAIQREALRQAEHMFQSLLHQTFMTYAL